MNTIDHISNQFLNLWHNLANIDFIQPWALAIVPLPWMLRLLLKPLVKTESPLLAPHLVKRLSLQPMSSKHQHTARAKLPLIALLIWGGLVLAAMRPVLFLQPAGFTTSGRDIILAVDLSGSMETEDMVLHGQRANRLELVKSVVSDFIQKRQGDQLGLVVFGSQAFIQSPLSYDLTTVNQLLQETAIGMAGNNTAIGDAIGLTLKHLAQQPKTKQHAIKPVLILLTDGSNTAGVIQPLEAAEQAKKMGLKIYTIGIGQPRANTLSAFLNGGRQMDVQTLTHIADTSGGRFFLASDAEQLNQIYDEINRLESTEHQVNQYRLRTELYPWPLGLALLLSFGLALTRLRPLPSIVSGEKHG